MKKATVIPTLKFKSDYFFCPKCGWITDGPMRVLGDYAQTTVCKNCGHVGLERKK